VPVAGQFRKRGERDNARKTPHCHKYQSQKVPEVRGKFIAEKQVHWKKEIKREGEIVGF